jgi:hypothetical protein
VFVLVSFPTVCLSVWSQVIDAIEDPGIAGEMFSSAGNLTCILTSHHRTSPNIPIHMYVNICIYVPMGRLLMHVFVLASFDPTFWPLHGSIERLLGLKRISVLKGDISRSDLLTHAPTCTPGRCITNVLLYCIPRLGNL